MQIEQNGAAYSRKDEYDVDDFDEQAMMELDA
jgi:hypothetical protein